MSDFLTSLATRALQPSGEVQPQLLSLFEPGHLGDETAKAGDDGIPRRSRATGEDEIAPEKASARRHAPHTIAARLDQLDAILPPHANAPTASVPQPPLSPRDDGSPREVSANRDSPPADADGKSEMPFPEPVTAHAGRTDETKLNLTAPITRVTPRHGSVIAATPPEDKMVSSRPRPIIPAETPPIAVPLRLPRESTVRSSDPARDAEPRVIQISIGRLEIRASTSPPLSRPRAGEKAPQATTLDEYLRDKSGGSR